MENLIKGKPHRSSFNKAVTFVENIFVNIIGFKQWVTD